MSRSDEVVYQQDDDWNMFPSYFIVCFFFVAFFFYRPFMWPVEISVHFQKQPAKFQKLRIPAQKCKFVFSFYILTSEPVTDDHRTQKRQQQFAMLCVSLWWITRLLFELLLPFFFLVMEHWPSKKKTSSIDDIRPILLDPIQWLL